MLEKTYIDKAFGPYIGTKLTASTDKKKLTAGMTNDTPGVCPYCKKPMKTTICADQNVFVCWDDRTVLPKPESEA